MHVLLALLLLLGPACTELTLEADSYSFGGHRFDAPEHIRGLHLRGDPVGAPVRLAADTARSFYLWALDTELDGLEHYDRLATSTTGDIDESAEQLVPIDTIGPNRAETPGGAVRFRVITFDRDLRHVKICIEP